MSRDRRGEVELSEHIDFEYFLEELGTGREIWTTNINL